VKLFILGFARHGKDTFAEMLCDVVPSIAFVSSSQFVNERAVLPTLSVRYGYETPEECFEDRMNHRAEWKDLISAFNEADPARLARELFESFDLYVGLRCEVEFLHAKPLADLAIWVKDPRKPDEPTSSNTITEAHCDLTVLNDGDLDDLREKVNKIARALFPESYSPEAALDLLKS
jgi:hypothetical protein